MENQELENKEQFWLGDRPVKEWGKVPLEDKKHVWVLYADEQLPQGEVVHEDEWNQRTTAENKDRQSLFVASIKNLQQEIMGAMVGHNIKWIDVAPTMDWVMESMKRVRNELNNLLFKTTDWEAEVTPSKCIDLLKKAGKEPELNKDLNDLELQVVKHFIEKDISFMEMSRNFNSFFSPQKVLQSVFDLQNQALETALEAPQTAWRLDMVEAKIKELRNYEKPENKDGVESSDSPSASQSDKSEGETVGQPSEEGSGAAETPAKDHSNEGDKAVA